MCTGADQDRLGACLPVGQSGLGTYPEIRCSVRVDAPKPTLFTARLFYEGQLQRSYRLVLEGRRGRAIFAAFTGLEGMPGGRYRCEFTLGGAHASVAQRSTGPTSPIRGASACPVYGTGSRVCSATQPVYLSDPRSIACSAVVVSRRGQVAHTVLERRDGTDWTTLYEARDRLQVPIAEVWAYTTAPGRKPFPTGDYRCRFQVGQVVVDRPFAIHSR